MSFQVSDVAIRRFFKETLTVQRLIDFGSMTPEAAAVLEALVVLKQNVVVAGGNVQWGDFAVRLAMRDPCARRVSWPIPQAVEDTGVLLVGQANTPLNRDESERLVAIRSFAQENYTLVDRPTQSQGVLEIWRRDDAWFSNYCANHSRGR